MIVLAMLVTAMFGSSALALGLLRVRLGFSACGRERPADTNAAGDSLPQTLIRL
jgi:hypothetical protein